MLKHLTWRVASNRHLDQPRRSLAVAPHYDPDAFGRVSEGIARYFGTARYLVIQTMMVIIWIAINAVWASGRWDPYPFILLNLAFSTPMTCQAPTANTAAAEPRATIRSTLPSAACVRARRNATALDAGTEFIRPSSSPGPASGFRRSMVQANGRVSSDRVTPHRPRPASQEDWPDTR